MKERSVRQFVTISKMYLPLIAVLSSIVCVCQVLSQTNNYEYSDQQPWSLVYTLYPFYNSETLLEVWKGDKGVDISTNIVTLAPREQEQTVLYPENVQHNGTTLKPQDNLSYFLNEAKNINEEQSSKNRQRLSSYRNRHKDTNLQSE